MGTHVIEDFHKDINKTCADSVSVGSESVTSLKRTSSGEAEQPKCLKRRSSSTTSISVGKCPPRDMKRLVIGKPYTIDRVAKWGDKLALFLSNPDDSNDAGFFKPPEAFRDLSFYAGGTVTLKSIGYSSSRNRIAQKISVDSGEAACCNGCVNNSDPEMGCCYTSVLKSISTPFLDSKAPVPPKTSIPSHKKLQKLYTPNLDGLLFPLCFPQSNTNSFLMQPQPNLFSNNPLWATPGYNTSIATLLQDQQKLNMAMLNCLDTRNIGWNPLLKRNDGYFQ